MVEIGQEQKGPLIIGACKPRKRKKAIQHFTEKSGISFQEEVRLQTDETVNVKCRVSIFAR